MILAVNFFDSVTSFLSSIGDFFKLAGRLIANTLSSIVHAVQYIFSAQYSLNVVINYLPAIVAGACFAFVAVGILRFILGK